MSLKGRTALVTGGGSGIGRAMVKALLAEKAAVVLVGRRASALAETAAGDAWASLVMADLTAPDAPAALARRIKDDFGGLDILVHCAGLYARDHEADKLDAMQAINVRAPETLTRALLPMLIATQGEIAFVNSTILARPPPEGLTRYAESKRDLQAFANRLRDEVNPQGVRVLSLYAGRTATPMQAQIFATERRTYVPERLLQPEDVAQAILQAMRMPRSAEITDLTIRPMQKS